LVIILEVGGRWGKSENREKREWKEWWKIEI
jgi:hypothetical protein